MKSAARSLSSPSSASPLVSRLGFMVATSLAVATCLLPLSASAQLGVTANTAASAPVSVSASAPAASPAPAPAATPPTADDAGAAGPDEALSDAADEPHAVTTPDDPAEVVDLESSIEDAPKKK